MHDIEFMWWVRRLMFFKGSFVQEMKAAGDEMLGIYIAGTEDYKNQDLIAIFWHYKDEPAFQAWVKSYETKWMSLQK